MCSSDLDDVDLKCEELEMVRLETQDLGAKVKYRGQDLYSHITFAMEASRDPASKQHQGHIGIPPACPLKQVAGSTKECTEEPRKKTKDVGRLP